MSYLKIHLQVRTHIESWGKHRDTQSKYAPQLEWEAGVAEYVTFLHRETRAPPTPKNSTKISAEKPLKAGIPIYGPRFIPPSFNDARLIMSGKIKPQTAYLRPINIIHPVYYPNLRRCPHCRSGDVNNVRWDGWTGTGSREVHGLRREETALGYQLRHENCPLDESSTVLKNRSFATTNQLFWKGWEHWKIPRMLLHFDRGYIDLTIHSRRNPLLFQPLCRDSGSF
ncbi:hypothetical protein C8R44DRAFT_645317 [Mycena epipterygia]|nr:hypothetical protein C8R44DRAFT_645317 [Mycena epipterygia]